MLLSVSMFPIAFRKISLERVSVTVVVDVLSMEQYLRRMIKDCFGNGGYEALLGEV